MRRLSNAPIRPFATGEKPDLRTHIANQIVALEVEVMTIEIKLDYLRDMEAKLTEDGLEQVLG